jgi:type 1 glutamine amidotransferase
MKKCFLRALLISTLYALALSANAAEKLNILIITGGHGFDSNSFFQVFKDNPEITFTAAAQGKASATAYERPDLLDFDSLVLYDMPKNISDAQKEKFLSIFEKGVGLVVLHHAIVSYQHWPEYEKVIGGRYPEADGKSGVVTEEVGYQHDVDIPVAIVAKDHPITAGLNDFTIKDEIYWGFKVQPDVTPLLTTTHPKSGKPLAWCRIQSKSRVVYLQLGHGPSAFNDPNYRKLLAQSIRWASKR